jgi:CheY-like chemotaxis protein
MMTSIGQRGDAARLHEIGFAAYLTKPVRQSDLHDTLGIVLAGKETAREKRPIVTRHLVREMQRANVRILLAEDNVVNQRVVLSILRSLGLRAETVANGHEAIRALETMPFDLVLMDIQMPEMNGYEATQVIRDPGSAVLNHRVPIIALTANAMRGDREKYLQAGMDDYISKPVRPQTLAEVLSKWLPAAVLAEKRETGRQAA